MRRITAILLCLLLINHLTGCSDTSHQTGNSDISPKSEKSTPTVSIESDEKSDQGIFFESLFLKYLLFVPSNFGNEYISGLKYQEGIDLWTKLQYDQAEKCLLTIEHEIETSKAEYPDDIAFVKEAIGCLYIDMARYDEAYDYLLDALIKLREIYGDKALYTNAVSMALCHYYYALGDYERCLKEIQTLRGNNSTDYIQDNHFAYLKLFISVVLNDLEADICFNQYIFSKAYNLYVDNLNRCMDFVSAEEDATFSSALEVDALIALGDYCSTFTSDEKLCSLADTVYEKALALVEHYEGEYKEAKKAEILMKRGYFLCNFSDRADSANESMKQAMEIQEHLYETDATYPGLVESYRLYAEYLGFILRDGEGADKYYQKAIKLCEQSYKHNHPETARIYESLGRYYGNRRRKYEEAAGYLREGIEIYKNLIIENDPLVARMYLQLAGCCRLLGDEESCQEYLEKNKEIETKLGYSHLTTGDAKQN